MATKGYSGWTRAIRMVAAVLLLCGILAAPSPAVSKATEEAEALLVSAGECRKALEASPKKKSSRHNWLACVDRYRKVVAAYPKSSQAAWALFRSAGLYVGMFRLSGIEKDLDEAIALYRRLVEEHKGHSLADDAQYKIGEIFYTLKNDPTQAYVEFLKVDVNHPSGDMRPKAKEILNKLAETLHKKDAKSGSAPASAPKGKRIQVKGIRHWSTPNYTRVVIDVEAPVAYEHHLLEEDPDHAKPRRIYMDLKNARIPKGIDSVVAIKNDLLQAARAGQYTLDTVRVVLDTEKISGYKVFHLYDPFRIVVDVQGAAKETDGRPGQAVEPKVEPKPETKPETQIAPGAEPRPEPKIEAGVKPSKRGVRKGIRKEEKPDGAVSLARQLGLTVKRIVLDPGHGGKDPGCRIGGRYEKDITLSIAKILARKLKEKLGCEVFLTRDRDTFLSLEQRTAIANMKKADLFISLHVNAHKDERIHGLETYFLNMATDQNAVLVAARENAASEKSISDLQAILNDLMRNTKIHESSRLAHSVQEGMVEEIRKSYGDIKSLGVKQAPFYVLIGAAMPAVLVEVGFLSNSVERGRLVSRKYQEGVTDGIYGGIKSYVRGMEQAYRVGGTGYRILR